MSTGKSDKDKDFERKMKRLMRESGAEPAKEIENDFTAPGIKQAAQGLTLLGNIIHKASLFGQYMWGTFLKPTWNAVSPAFSWIGRTYKNQIWDRFAYNNNDDGTRELSKKKAGAVLAATFALAALSPSIIGGTIAVGQDAASMAATTRTEIMYLHTPSSHNDGTYSVKGCEQITECGPSEVSRYNIEPSLMRHAWTLVNHGRLYTPSQLVGTISPDSNNKCEVKVYGTWGADMESTMQQFGVYPQLLDVTCVRVDNQGRPLSESMAPAGGGAVQTPAPVVQGMSPN